MNKFQPKIADFGCEIVDAVSNGLTAHIYEKCRRPKATKKAKTKTSKISKTSVFHRFFIFEVLVSFPQVEMGRKPKPPISKTSQKPLLKNLSVFDFRFWGRFWRRQFSYMCDVSHDLWTSRRFKSFKIWYLSKEKSYAKRGMKLIGNPSSPVAPWPWTENS